MRSLASVSALVESLYPAKDTERRYRDAKLPSVPFLPQDYVFDNGTRATIRNVRKDEDEILYDLFKSSALASDGYDALEYISLNHFREEKMMTNYGIVYEETSTGRVIGCNFVGDCAYTRSEKSRISIASLVLSREFQNGGFGREIIGLDGFISRKLGYVAMINDIMASNKPMNRLMSHVWGDNLSNLGRTPNGAYSTKHGWDDLIVLFFPYDDFAWTDFEEFARKSFSKHQRPTSAAGDVISSGSGTFSKL